MANEFRIKNGFFSEGNSIITGSLNVTAGVTGSFTGSFVGSGVGLTGLSAFPFTGSALITGSLGITGSASILAYTSSAASIFTVRNSANTSDLISLAGDGTTTLNGATTFGNTVRMVTTANEILGIQNNFSTSNTFSGLNITRPSTGGSYFNGSGNLYLIYHSQTKTNTYVQSSAEIYSYGLRTIYYADGNSGNNRHEFHVGNPQIQGAATTASLKMAVSSTGVQITGSLGVTGSLEARAQGSASSDINFRVIDNANAYNVLDLQGNAVLNLRVNNTATAPASGSNVLGTNIDTIVNARATNTSGTMLVGFQGIVVNSGASVGLYSDGGGKVVSSTAGVLQHNSGAGSSRMNFVSGTNTTGWSFLYNTGTTFAVGNTVFSIYPTNAQGGGGTLALGTTLGTTISSLPAAAFGKNTFFIANGTAPTTSSANSFALYSSASSAGNAKPYFRTENNTIIWFGDESRLFNITSSNITASDIIASSLTIPSGSVTITTGSVTMPNRPAFSVYGSGTTNNLSTTQNGDGTLNSNNYATTYYQGSGFDSGSGVFTAPIAGLYQVTLIGRNSGYAAGISQLAVLRNNSNANGDVMMIEWAASSTMNHTGGGQIFRLAVGDTLRLKVLAGQINFDGNDNWSVAYIG